MIGNNVTPFLDELTANESAKSQNPTQRILWPWTKIDHIKIRKTHPSTWEGEGRGDVCLKDYISVLLLA